MTFTVIARDPKHKLLGIAQSTNPLSVGGRCPFIRANVGAVSSQATTDPGLGPLAIELLTLGHHPDKVLADLQGVGGTVLRTSFDETKEAALAAALAGAQAEHAATHPAS